jgi:catechol 2,3-dioxygenase-like lactoylglutathione lyase family enzyme
MINKIRHTGLVVSDILVSINFYEQLGLTIWKHELESGKFISHLVGFDNAVIETAKLKVPDGSILELLEYKSHPSEQKGLKYESNRHGCSHVAFNVNDIEKISKKIVQLGGSIVNKPALSDNGLVKVIYCHDLDGILLEFVEEL